MNNNSNEFPWQGMLVVSILGLISGLILFFTGCFNITTYNELYTYMSEYGLGVIFSLFFIGVAIYCWISFFRNFILKPKKVVLYLLTLENSVATFIDRKGKTFSLSNCIVDVGRYYYVLKTSDIIKEVLGESYETFVVPKEKKSYWLNFYSPIGKFEDIFLLPIVYVILLPGILSIIMSGGYQKIYGIIYSLFPCYVIIYDFIYKVKLKNSNKLEIDDSKLVNSYYILVNTIKILFVVIINGVLIYIYMNSSDYITKLILSPFCLYSLCSAGYVISKVFKNNTMVDIFNKGYTVIFLLFWFGFLIFFTMGIIREGNNYGILLFTIPFWIAGLFIFYKSLIKKK